MGAILIGINYDDSETIMKDFKTIFISDTHLGSQNANARELHSFLSNSRWEHLYIVGDFLDFWTINSNRCYWDKHHTKVIKILLERSQQGHKITYLIGNHDGALRRIKHIFPISLANITLCDQAVYESASGKKYLVMHGDQFEQFPRWCLPFVKISDIIYQILVWFSRSKQLPSHRLSLSKQAKKWAKKRVNKLFNIDRKIHDACKKNNVDGIILGHTHEPKTSLSGCFEVINDGDWVEHNSALIELEDGTLQHYFWATQEMTDEDIDCSRHISS